MATVVDTGTGWELYDDGTLEVSPEFSSNNSSYYYRNSVTSVTFTGSLTEIGSHAFERCVNLTSITIPSTVIRIGYSAFSDCSALESVSLSEGLTEISDYAFSRCVKLTSITIPFTVTSIGYSAFSGCSLLTSAYFMRQRYLEGYDYYAFPYSTGKYYRGLNDIDITSLPYKRMYEVGETFDRTGMVVTATFNEGFPDSSSEVITNYSVTPAGAFTSASDSYVVVSYTYEGFTVSDYVQVTLILPVNSGNFTVRATFDFDVRGIGIVPLETDFPLMMGDSQTILDDPPIIIDDPPIINK